MKIITNFGVVNYSFLSSSSPALHRRHPRVIIHHVTPLAEERVEPSVVGQEFFLTITWRVREMREIIKEAKEAKEARLYLPRCHLPTR